MLLFCRQYTAYPGTDMFPLSYASGLMDIAAVYNQRESGNKWFN